VGFEPTNGGFADLSLGPLGYRAKQASITKSLSRLEHWIETSEEIAGCAPRSHFFSSGDDTRASRKNRAASSGGVGLM
jgi:hypothetical protein